MSGTNQIAPNGEPFPAAVWRKVDSSLLWALWAIYAAEDALHWPVDELAVEMARRPKFAWRVRQIFKMLLIEEFYAPARAEQISAMVAHVRAALVEAGLDASNGLMHASIDYEVVPKFGGVAASDVNCIRAEVPRELDFDRALATSRGDVS